MSSELRKCRACGASYPLETPVCPRCHVPRKGDVNRAAVRAYLFFLALAVVLGWLALRWASRGV